MVMDKRSVERASKATDKRNGGKPSKFTPERRAAILNHLKLGGYLDDACALAGVHVETVREWVGRGHAEEERCRVWKSPRTKRRGPAEGERVSKAIHRRLRRQNKDFVTFAHDVAAAEAMATASMLGIISKAAMGGAIESTTTTTRRNPDGSVETNVVEKRALPNWQPAAWKLDRRHPNKFGSKQRLDVRTEDAHGDDYLALLGEALDRMAGHVREPDDDDDTDEGLPATDDTDIGEGDGDDDLDDDNDDDSED